MSHNKKLIRNWGLQEIGDGSADPLLEKRPFSGRETLKRWKRINETLEEGNYG